MTQSRAHPIVDTLITYYDDATGERAALTAVELGGWSAATAALLTEGCGLGPGRQAAVLLPPHWQTAAVLLGVELRRVTSWLDDVPSARHRFVLGLAPGSATVTQVPADYQDYTRAVRSYLGAVPPDRPVDVHSPATVERTSYGQYGAIAASIAEMHGIGPGDRVLIDATVSEEPLVWLLAPLSVGASVVLCANLNRSTLDERIAAERVTRVL